MRNRNQLLVLLAGLTFSVAGLSAKTGGDGGYKVLVSGKSQAEADVSFISQDSSLVCLGSNGAIRIYDARSGQRLNSISTQHTVKKIFIPRGNEALYCLTDDKILKYSMPAGKLLWQRAVNDIYPFMQFSGDGTRLFCLGSREEGQPIQQLNLKTGATQKAFFIPEPQLPDNKTPRPDPDRWIPEYVSVRTDGSAVGTVNTGTEMAEVFLTESGKNYQLPLHQGKEIRLAMHPRKPELAMVTRDSLYVHNWEDGRLLLQVPLGNVRSSWYTDVRFSPDGKLFSCIRAADSGTSAVLTQQLFNADGYKAVGRKEFPQAKKDIPRLLGQESAFAYARDSVSDNLYFVRRFSLADHRELYRRPYGLSQPFLVKQTQRSPGGRWTAIETEVDFVVWDNLAGRSIRRLPKTEDGTVPGADAGFLPQSVMEFTANDSLLLIHFGPLHVLNCAGGGGTIYKDTADVASIHPYGKSLALISGTKAELLDLPAGDPLFSQVLLSERKYMLPKYSVHDTAREVSVKATKPGLKFNRNGQYLFVSYIHSFKAPRSYLPNEYFNLKRLDIEKAQLLTLNSLDFIPPTYLPDPTGEYVFYEGYNSIETYDVFNEKTMAPLQIPEEHLHDLRLSADGKVISVAYTPHTLGQPNVYLHFNFNRETFRLDSIGVFYGEKGRLKTELLSSVSPFLVYPSADRRSAEFFDAKGIMQLSLCFPDPASWVAITPDGFVELSSYALQWIQFTNGATVETSGRQLEERRKTGLFQKRVAK